jgi:hypothetical protein
MYTYNKALQLQKVQQMLNCLITVLGNSVRNIFTHQKEIHIPKLLLLNKKQEQNCCLPLIHVLRNLFLIFLNTL